MRAFQSVVGFLLGHHFPAITLVLCGVASVEAQTPFTVVALPDTQNYVNNASNAPLFTQQTQWIADQLQIAGNPRNIQFVTHLGDLVSTGSDLTQWQRADTSMDVLDGVIEYSVLPGNLAVELCNQLLAPIRIVA